MKDNPFQSCYSTGMGYIIGIIYIFGYKVCAVVEEARIPEV